MAALAVCLYLHGDNSTAGAAPAQLLDGLKPFSLSSDGGGTPLAKKDSGFCSKRAPAKPVAQARGFPVSE